MDDHQPVLFKIKRKPVGFQGPPIPTASSTATNAAAAGALTRWEGPVDSAEPHGECPSRPLLLQSPSQHSQEPSSRSTRTTLQISGSEEGPDGKGKSLVTVVANSQAVINDHTDPTASDLVSVGEDPPPCETIPTTTEAVFVSPAPAANQKQSPLAADNHAEGLPSSSSSASTSSFLRTALDEARYFAGGLLPRPHESTKHYTILRHSPSIVFYRGPSTCVVVTVFSSSEPNTPLPADRTVWLQQRGYSGDAGMSLKRLVGASTANWLNVTPTTLVSEQEVGHPSHSNTSLAADERGWKRDIGKFMKKHVDDQPPLYKTGRRPRETLIIRLPALVEDGYFRLVLCTGGGKTLPGDHGVMHEQDGSSSPLSLLSSSSSSRKRRKVLCTSPIFRVASTSIDPSIMKGASLKTLPLELGVLVGSTVGLGKVRAALAPVTTKVQSQLQAIQPPNTTAATQAATTAYAVSGLLREKVSAAEMQYRDMDDSSAGDAIFGKLDEGTNVDADLDVVGSDDGPERPYPLRFVGKVCQGTGGRRCIPGLPTANLIGISDDILYRLKGTYFGWACVLPTTKESRRKGSSIDWYEALISVGPGSSPHDGLVAPKHTIVVHLIHDFDRSCSSSIVLDDAKLEVILLAALPSPPAPDTASTTTTTTTNTTTAATAAAVERNIQVTLSSLSRPKWGPQVTLQKMKEVEPKKASSFSDKYVQARQQIARRADTLVPLHLAGVRTAGGEARDRVIGNGGYWIPRSC